MKKLTKNLLCCAIALFAFIATSALIHSLLPPIIPKGIAAKLKFFSEHRDEFDTVIVGTSRLYYSVSPEIFDATTRENGLPTRTFNFGVDGMHPPENFYVLEQILKTKPRNLKWVLVELGDIQTKWDNILGTQRAVSWHDWPRTSLTLRKALNPRGNANWLIKLSRLWLARRDLISNLMLFGKQFTSVGRAADFLPSGDQDRFADADFRARAQGRWLSDRGPRDVHGAGRDFPAASRPGTFRRDSEIIDPATEEGLPPLRRRKSGLPGRRRFSSLRQFSSNPPAFSKTTASCSDNCLQ